jgi:threonine dehydrogenase-like Zn-dependent dehydrogenase
VVKSLEYYPSIPRYLAANALGKRFPVGAAPLRLVSKSLPEKPGFVTVRVRLCGICGSDLALLLGKSSPRLSPFFSFPAVLGHEILGEIDGQRVAINPILGCRERGLPSCAACESGEDGLCRNAAEGSLAPGLLGFCRDLPGGWGPQILAHSKRIHAVPEGVPDARAALAEPLAVSLRGIRMAKGLLGSWPDRLLIIGGGSIGLLAVAALRGEGYSGKVHVIARHPVQAQTAQDLGSDAVHASFDAAAQAGGGKSYPAIIGPSAWRGGYPLVIDAAGSQSSLDQSAWAVAEGGTVVFLGAPATLKHDFAPHWFREIKLVGSYTYSRQDFADSVNLLAALPALDAIPSVRFALSEWKSALRAVLSRRTIKAMFDPNLT